MKIRFLNITIENGLTWKRLNFPLANQGLVLIRGSNGVGKSGIRELLGLPFYGKSEKSGAGNDLINRKVGKEFRVLVELDREEAEGWVRYNVLCTRKCAEDPTGVRIWRGDDEDPITPVKNPVEAQKMAAGLMGMSFGEFLSVVSIGQESVHPLIDGTDGSRSDYISKTFDLEYGHYLEAVQKRLKATNAALEGIIAKRGERQGWAAQQMDSQGLVFNAAKRDRFNTKISRIDKDNKGLAKEIRTLDRLVDSQKRRAELESSQGPAPRASSKIEKYIRTCQAGLKVLEVTDRQWQALGAAQKSLARLKRELPAERPVFCKEARDKWISRHGRLIIQLNQYDRLGGASVCPTCGQDASHLEKVDPKTLREKADGIHVRIQADVRSEDAAKDYDRLAKAIANTKIPPDPDTSVEDTAQNLKEGKAELHTLEVEYREALQAEARLAEMAKLPEGDWRQTRIKAREAQETLRVNQEEQAALVRELAGYEAAAKRQEVVNAKIEALDAEIAKAADLDREKFLLTGLAAAFGPRGLKREKVRDILDIIAHHLRSYSSTILPKYKFRLVDNEKKTSFVAVHKDSNTEGDVRSLSKGEKKALSLALILTERDIRRVKTNILFLDEFDGGLDAQSSENLMELLSELKGEYESIYAISQNPRVQDYEGFDRIATVTRQGVFSKIQWS